MEAWAKAVCVPWCVVTAHLIQAVAQAKVPHEYGAAEATVAEFGVRVPNGG